MQVDEPARIQEAIDRARGQLPARPVVVDVRFELGDDSTGDPAVFVMTLLDEQTRDEEWTSENLDPIVDQLTEAVVGTGLDRLVYVRFARPSEASSNGVGA